MPVLTTNCSNNYGPLHFPEKLIPLVIVNALAGKPLPIYGDGMQVRDWLYVRDHCSAIRRVLEAGRWARPTTWAAGTRRPTSTSSRPCAAARRAASRADGKAYAEQITYVTDRPGHDRRYAIDARKIERELGWKPAETFETGIRKTVQWYLDNPEWVADVQSGAYRDWVQKQYTARLRHEAAAAGQERPGRLGAAAQPRPAGRGDCPGPADGGDSAICRPWRIPFLQPAPGCDRQCRRPHRGGQGRASRIWPAPERRGPRGLALEAKAWAPCWCTTAPTTSSTAAAVRHARRG
jgi:hypothetical protein